MTFSSISVFVFFISYIFMNVAFSLYQNRLRNKYNAHTWHYGYLADRKLYKMLDAEDKEVYDQKAKRLRMVLLTLLIYAVSIFMLSGIFFNGKL